MFFSLSFSFVLFFFSCFIHFHSLFIESCFSFLIVLIMIVYCLLYFPTNYHSLIMLSLICVCLLLFIHAFPPFLVHVLLCSLVVVHPFSLTISSCSSFKYLPNMLLFVGLALVLHWYDHLPPFLLYANLRMGSLKDLRFKAWTSLIK
jgi:hypothetical protein